MLMRREVEKQDVSDRLHIMPSMQCEDRLQSTYHRHTHVGTYLPDPILHPVCTALASVVTTYDVCMAVWRRWIR